MGENGHGPEVDQGESQRQSEVVFWAALAALAVAAMAITVLAARVDQFPGDLLILEAIQGLRSAVLDRVMLAATWLGFEPQTILVAGIVSIGLWVIGLRRAAVFAFATLLGNVVGYWLKIAVSRPRPPSELAYPGLAQNDFGFPSGHALHAALFYGFLAFIVWRCPSSRLWRWAVVVVVGLVTFAILTGVSRVYLGVHWPSDVLGGFLIGLVLLLLLAKAYVSAPTLPGGVNDSRSLHPPDDGVPDR